MTDSDPKSSTRDALIEAGLHFFGHKGFDATSTREIAARAGTNVASISYHFGGKAGLRTACARAVAERITSAIDADRAFTPPANPAEAATRIEVAMRALIGLVVGAAQSGDLLAFMLREITDPGEVADLIYAEFLEPRHRAFCGLWAAATGRDAEDPEIKLAIFSIVGQVLYFRIARPFVGRRLGWETVGPAEIRTIVETIVANLRDTIERLKA